MYSLVGTKTWGSMTGRVADQGLTVDSDEDWMVKPQHSDRGPVLNAII